MTKAIKTIKHFSKIQIEHNPWSIIRELLQNYHNGNKIKY